MKKIVPKLGGEVLLIVGIIQVPLYVNISTVEISIMRLLLGLSLDTGMSIL